MASSDSEGPTSGVEKTPTKRKLDDGEGSAEDGEADESLEVPKVKKSPGRPKGSKNKTAQEEKPEVDPVAKRPRGRPKKWPPVEKPTNTGPKRGRGRPKKNPDAPPVEKPTNAGPKSNKGRRSKKDPDPGPVRDFVHKLRKQQIENGSMK